VKVFGPKPLVPAMLPLIFGKSSLKNPAVREVISYWKQKLLALPKTIVGPVSGVTKRRDVTNELSKITCPTLMVVGDEDRTTPLSNANNIAAHIANTDLKIIPECGHSSALEKPEQVVALMKQFYSRLS
ncbi:MAG: alpha/beta fold hydrolase, partial [Arenimonas sp.]